MDTVVLAAGRGSRLEGQAAPFWKPLTVVNGEPLIVRLVGQAVTINLGRTVVVVSPENAQPICQVLAHHDLVGPLIDIVVQPVPGGPGDAFLRAAPYLTETPEVMILCGDNVIPDGDIEECRRCYAHDGCSVVGTRTIEDPVEARQFTLISPDGDFSEGAVHGMEWSDGRYRAWLGPLVVNTTQLREALRQQRQVGELKIGANLGIGASGPPHLVVVDCYDIGTPR